MPGMNCAIYTGTVRRANENISAMTLFSDCLLEAVLLDNN